MEAACQFSIYCKEPLDIIEVKESILKKGKSPSFKPTRGEVVTRANKIGMSRYKIVKKRGGSASRVKSRRTAKS